MSVAWYLFSTTLRRRWGSYLAVTVLIALIGGTAMASVAAARRTQSSYPQFLASTDPADLTFSTYGTGPQSTANAYSPDLAGRIAALPQVRHVETWVGVFGAPLKADGSPDFSKLGAVNEASSLSGLYFHEDRATPVIGRMANPKRPDEFVTTELGAKLLGLHVGDVMAMGFYGADQPAQPGFGTAAVPPQVRLNMKLVGLVVFNNEVIEDDADRLPTNVLFTPALTKLTLGFNGTQGSWFGLQLAHPARDVPAVESEIVKLLPGQNAAFFRTTSVTTSKVERALRPEAIALATFGLIAALAALAIAGQAIARIFQAGQAENAVLRALGAEPMIATADSLIGTLAAIFVGAVLAVGIAILASPLGPLGPVRRVYPYRGIAADWGVLGIGVAVLVVGLGGVALLVSYRAAPHRVAERSTDAQTRTSTSARVAASSGLGAPAVVGIRFALEPGAARTAVPVRSVLFAGVAAVAIAVATVVFGSSLNTLVATPSLYGWNWDYALYSLNDVPPQATDLLARDHDVAAFSPAQALTIQLDGQSVPSLLTPIRAPVGPPILNGQGIEGARQVVVGPETLAALHKQVGDTVLLSYGSPADAPLAVLPTPVKIVGTATLPAMTTSATLADHPSVGTGALVPFAVFPAAFQQAISNPDPTLNGPGTVFIRLRPGVSVRAGRADMDRIVTAANKAFASDPNGVGDSAQVLTVQRPAEIVNYRSTGATPVILATGLALGALVALGLALLGSARRHKRELAVLKTLGFTRRQIATTVAWQASTVAGVGVIVGLPLGIVVGRQLWILFAHQIFVVPEPTVPISLLLIAIATIILANVFAFGPGRVAARISPGLALTVE